MQAASRSLKGTPVNQSEIDAAVAEHFVRIHRAALALCGNPWDADDLAQNEIGKALIILNQFFSNNIDNLKEIILLQQRWNDLKQRIRGNLIAEADASIEKSKISNALIEIASDVPSTFASA